MPRKLVKNADRLPATRGDVRRAQEELAQMILKGFLTKEDAKSFLTKEDAKNFLTKEDAKNFATKDDLRRFATKDDLRKFKDEIMRGFQVVAENIHNDVAGANADDIKFLHDRQTDHEQRIVALEKTR